ncbi:MAG TPA: methyltransferase, partial [Mycobacteriales bacterium]|nr:methyltransferase [Mycobacteriales bacterium]
GYRVELAEVEAALGSHPAVAAAVVLADGDRLVSFAVPASRPHTAPGRIPEVPEVPDQPNREADRADDAGAVAAAAGAAGAMATAGIDGELLASFLERADGVALDAIVCTLRAAGLFAVSTATHDLDEITAALGADPRHRRVLRRWVSALTGAGRLVGEAGGRYRGLDTVEPAALARRWDDLADTERTLGYGADLLALIRTSSAQLAELLRCERDPLDLLFPQGTWSVAEGVYRDNLVSQCLNQAVVAGLRAIAERTGDRPLRVLEVGAGVGGTSTVLVPALAEFPVDYLFTDVSPFFTTQAAGRLGRYPWVRYGLFDINADPRAQGLLPNSFDVLVCQNVLHNARDAAVVLGRLRELLAPGGWLVIVETTVERHPLLVSMDFVDGLAAGFDDVRGDADRTFLSRDQWLDLLTAAGAETALCYPEPHEALALAGQHVFLARVKVDRAPVTSAELVAHAAARLPEHMVPAQVQVLDALPLTPNAKVDRELLRGWLPARAEARPGAAPADEPRDDLERRVAEVWMRVLDCPRVGRNDNFFTLGGDSLLVARLVGQLREREPRAAQTDWESLLRQMLLSPTVAGLAAFLRSAPPAPDLADTGGNTGGDADAGAGADADPTPVTFTRAGAGPVRVLVHDGSGTLLPYQALLDEMARRPAAGPVLGVEAGPVDRYLHVDPAVLVERLAANHTRSLLAGGDDRFHVVGYCMGGLIATEVARMLTESGARVDGLTVISCYRPSFLVEEELVAEYAFALSLGVAPARLGYPCDDTLFGRAIDVVLAETPDRIPAGRIAELADDRGPHADLTEVGRCFQDLADRPQPDRLAALARAMPDSASAPRPEDLTRLYRVFRHSLSAVTRHRAEPYAGDITFLRHSGRYGFLPGLRENMGNYWREVCLGDLTVVDIPGDHFTCLSQPHAAGVYDLLPGGDR